METKPDIPTLPNGSSAPTKRAKIQLKGGAIVGSLVRTIFGNGICQNYRESDRMYEIRLTINDDIYPHMTPIMFYTQTVPEKRETNENETEQLNVAYVALEKMRRLNLEMQCFDAGVTHVDFDYCTTCLLKHSIPNRRFPRLQKMYEGQNVASNNALKGIMNFAATTNANVAKVATPLKLPKVSDLWISDNEQQTQNNDGSKSATEQQKKSASGIRLTAGVDFPKIQVPRVNLGVKIPGLWGTKQSNSINAATENAKESRDKNSELSKPQQKRVLPRIQNLMDARLKQQSSPCLICASPSCPQHSSASFRKDGITLCLSCERLFELNFIVNCVGEPDPHLRSRHIDHMVDCYDRCLLLLKYSAQYIETVALSLEESQEKQNKIGLGSSGVGVLSGVLGIAAAASILTPAGPPLLIASLVFGGTATTAQVGNEAMNYLSEPNKVADRIIALHGMTLSILRVTSTLRDAMMRDYIRTDGVFEADEATLPEKLQEKYEKNRTVIGASVNAGRGAALSGIALSEAGAVAGAEAGALAARAASVEASAAAAGARSATSMSRAGTAGTTAARSGMAGFARIAGGALSAAVILMEANAIQHTLKSIEEGNPCEKAKVMRQILEEIRTSSLPSTTALDEECQAYLNAMRSRRQPLPEVNAEAAEGLHVHRLPTAECIVASDEDLSVSGAVILSGNRVDDLSSSVTNEELGESRIASFLNTGSSLLERIQNSQHRQSSRSDEVFAVALDSDQAGQAELDLLS
jgi:hypothetical protein